MTRLMVVALVALVAGCGGAAARPEFPAPEDAEPSGRPGARVPARAAGLERAELDRALAAGPGAFLAGVKLRAVTASGRFVGWEILALDRRYETAGVHPGDVVRRVNARPVETPDELAALFAALHGAEALELSLLRGGSDAVVRIPILE